MQSPVQTLPAESDVREPQANRRSDPVARWPLVSALGIFCTASVVDILFTLKLCDGHFVYALDDAYIGAAMAKNVALHGVFGVTAHGFTSASSAPLWILLLAAAYWAVGVSVWIAPALSTLFAGLSIVLADRLLLKGLPAKQRALALAAVVLLTPLHVLSLIAMEHSLQVLLTIAFLRLALDWLENGKMSRWAPLILPSMILVRFEDMFLAASLVFLLACGKRWIDAIRLSVLAWAPVATYGAISVAKGWFWLPNSIAMKGASGSHIFLRFISNCVRGPDLATTALLLAVLARLSRSDGRARNALLIVFIASIQHLALAGVGWTYRYEDYLLALAVVAGALSFHAWKASLQREPALILVLLIPACVMAVRFAKATIHLPLHSRAVYRQQYQMSRFVHRFYDHQTIAANDIGAIDFFNDVNCVDLVGLANRDVFFAKRAGRYDTTFISNETASEGVRIAMVYESWFAAHSTAPFPGPPLPAQWMRIGRWKMQGKEELGSDTVSFYAVEPQGGAHLRSALKEFNASLPDGVEWLPN